MTPETTIASTLIELGFTPIEAEIYSFLLRDSPATGYRIAKALGRSFAVTYSALESLQSKGAILVDAGKSRLSRAVPPQEFLDHRERRFRDQRDRILRAAEDIPSQMSDARIYQITAQDQVYQRARTMLADAEARVLVELFPDPLQVLREDVEAAAGRGVDVTVRIYREAGISGARVVLSPFGSRTIDSFRSQWMALFIDGRQFLLAQLGPAGTVVHYAVWSANLILARAIYAYINSDLHHYAFRKRLHEADSLDRAIRDYAELEEAFPPGGDLGFQELIERYSDPSEARS
jgi:sugar-specific transcriptional regulator TrmB